MPALYDTFVIVEPMQHYLEYGSLVLHEIIQANKRAGQTILELIGDTANPERIKTAIQTLNPIVFCGVGHGNVDIYTVECTETLITASSSELTLFKDKVVHLNSCLTAQQLGPALIDAGAVAYVGSKQEFWFYIGDAAGTTRAVRSPFLAEYQFTASLLQGKTTGEARQAQLQRYEEEINYWLQGDGKNHPDASELLRILQINEDISTFLGESDIRPSQKLAVAPTLVLPLTFGASFLILGFLAYKSVAVPYPKS